MYCKYNLRQYISHLEEYLTIMDSIVAIDFYRKYRIMNNIRLRIDRIKEYLSIDIVKLPVKFKVNMNIVRDE